MESSDERRAGRSILVCAIAVISWAGHAFAEPPQTELYWGATHVHSSYSLDANVFNNFTLGPDVAYRFAKGEEVVTDSGGRARLDRPLDFLVVADHANYMGVFELIREEHPAVADHPIAVKINDFLKDKPLFNGVHDLLEFSALFEVGGLQSIS